MRAPSATGKEHHIHFAKQRACFFFFWQPCVSALSAFTLSDSRIAATFLYVSAMSSSSSSELPGREKLSVFGDALWEQNTYAVEFSASS